MKEGWEPLCKFLEKEIPDVPFPHENVRGEKIQKALYENPFFVRSRRETNLALVTIGLLFGFGTYKLVRCGGFSFLAKIFSKAASFFVDREVLRQ